MEKTPYIKRVYQHLKNNKNCKIIFTLFEFSDHYGAFLGSYDFKRLGFNVNFTENMLFNNSVSIPILHEVNLMKDKISVEASELIATELPVKVVK